MSAGMRGGAGRGAKVGAWAGTLSGPPRRDPARATGRPRPAPAARPPNSAAATRTPGAHAGARPPGDGAEAADVDAADAHAGRDRVAAPVVVRIRDDDGRAGGHEEEPQHEEREPAAARAAAGFAPARGGAALMDRGVHPDRVPHARGKPCQPRCAGPRVVRATTGNGEDMTTSTDRVPRIPLRGDTEIPQLGFGVFQVPPEDTADVVARAFETGYRHIDTAEGYENEEGVGAAIRASGLAREDVFVTTKCPNSKHGYDEARGALQGSLERLGLDFVDLYLIHWPIPSKDRYIETWKAFVDMQKEGLTRSIGVSNFQPDHLRRIIDETGVTPAINQVELHPRLQQAALRRVHDELGVVTEAWSPLAQGAVLDDPAITKIAGAHGVAPGQVVLRWHLQIGNVAIPKSVTPERIEQNLDVFGFELGDDEMGAIEALDAGERTGPDPDTFGG